MFYAAIFALSGAYMPFFPLWLQAVGLEPALIGVVVAVPTAARLLAVPIITAWAGRHDLLRGALICTVCVTFAGFLALGAMRSAVTIAIVLWLLAWAWTAAVPLADAFALRGVAYHRCDYGPIRLWGSVGYVAAALAAGLLGSRFGNINLIWAIAGVAGLCALSSFWLMPAGPAMPGALQVSKPGALLRTPAFLAILGAAALIQGSHSAYYTFSAISWQDAGMTSTTISLLWAFCVVVEIVLFAVSPRLGLSPAALIAIGGAGAALRWLIMTQEPPLAVLAGAQALHALSFGATHLGTMGLLASLVPGRIMANAQGFIATATGIVMASTGIACGWAFASVGQSIYYGMAAMALAGTIVIVTSRQAIRTAMASHYSGH
ncbi:MFS transporter [Bradyrhizobium sp. LHD-71]|uniref:MFS transporter n=1 Tax=Bradyrhizobium sp. LHD-71 TaxID=3072141 RepID=UPI00280D00AE|nr:MFS transporter [Bradyrhizobium sp. LHD-71]MDQ8728458.1 MFS transporter [Bradyrhizobium sp. LHD-71]